MERFLEIPVSLEKVGLFFCFLLWFVFLENVLISYYLVISFIEISFFIFLKIFFYL